jgi:hypothetical protein
MVHMGKLWDPRSKLKEREREREAPLDGVE